MSRLSIFIPETYTELSRQGPPMPERLHSITDSSTAHLKPSSQLWRAPTIASQAVVMSLVEIYFEIVYPIFPLFHRPTYIRKVGFTWLWHFLCQVSIIQLNHPFFAQC